MWMSTCLVFVFGALIEYAIANVLARTPETFEQWEELKEAVDEDNFPLLNENTTDGNQNNCTSQNAFSSHQQRPRDFNLTFSNRQVSSHLRSSTNEIDNGSLQCNLHAAHVQVHGLPAELHVIQNSVKTIFFLGKKSGVFLVIKSIGFLHVIVLSFASQI